MTTGRRVAAVAAWLMVAALIIVPSVAVAVAVGRWWLAILIPVGSVAITLTVTMLISYACEGEWWPL